PHPNLPRVSIRLLAGLLLLALPLFASAQTVIGSSSELVSAAQTGGDYLLAAGSYRLSETLVISADFRLVGEGMNLSRIISKAPLIAVEVTGDIDVYFEGVSFEYQGQEPADIMNIQDARFYIQSCRFTGGVFAEGEEEGDLFYGAGLWLYGTAQGVVRDSVAADNEQSGIHLEGKARLELYNSSIQGNDCGLCLFDETQLVMHGTNLQGNVLALYAEHDSVVTLAESRFTESLEGHVYILGNAQLEARSSSFETAGDTFAALSAQEQAQVWLYDNQLANNHMGAVYLYGQASAVFEANRFEQNGHDGFNAFSLSDDATAQLLANHFNLNGGGAISVFKNANVEIKGNRIENNGNWTAVYVAGNSQVTFTNNHLNANDGVGIAVLGEAVATVSANQFVGNYDEGVYLGDKARASLSLNSLQDNARGVALYDEAVAYMAVNEFAENLVGVVLNGQSFAILHENLFFSENSDGLQLWDASRAVVRENHFMRHTYAVVAASEAASWLERNELKENLHGLLVYEGARLHLRDNQFRDNDIALYLLDEAQLEPTGNSFEGNQRDVVRSTESQ
ncbi:MAG: hypothetical protein GFH24_608416n1, partial [Chloroflexi bacterium AL-N5]|nr:hypothetical protein [Chloroflexi bacterium AL-N5]